MLFGHLSFWANYFFAQSRKWLARGRRKKRKKPNGRNGHFLMKTENRRKKIFLGIFQKSRQRWKNFGRFLDWKNVRWRDFRGSSNWKIHLEDPRSASSDWVDWHRFYETLIRKLEPHRKVGHYKSPCIIRQDCNKRVYEGWPVYALGNIRITHAGIFLNSSTPTCLRA